MQDDNMKKGNMLISYTFPNTTLSIKDIDNECQMKRELTELVQSWKLKGYIGHYAIADDECISDKVKNEQPTAYDIDKVVEELESFAKLAEDRWTNGTSKHAYQEHKCWVKSIEIVKQGGVTDDVCEWKKHRIIDNVQMHKTSCLHEIEERLVKKYRYCPYCGKKIKVVE